MLQLNPGARFSKVPRTFRARKAICKNTTCLFCEAGLFICCKRNKNKNNCKVSCLETPLFWRYKENYVARNTPEKFRDLRETGPRLNTFAFVDVFQWIIRRCFLFIKRELTSVCGFWNKFSSTLLCTTCSLQHWKGAI